MLCHCVTLELQKSECDQGLDPFDQSRGRLVRIRIARLAVRGHIEGMDAKPLPGAGLDQRQEKFRLRVPAMNGQNPGAISGTRDDTGKTAERKIERDAFELRRGGLAPLQLNRRAEEIESGWQDGNSLMVFGDHSMGCNAIKYVAASLDDTVTCATARRMGFP